MKMFLWILKVLVKVFFRPVFFTDAPTGYVYLIENTENHKLKIGFSKNPLKRLQTLQTGSAAPLRLVSYVPGTMVDEQNLHAYFRHLHYAHEWFNDSPAIRNHFQPKTPLWKWITTGMVGVMVITCSLIAAIHSL